jgi:hypothetical protein
VKVLGGEEVFPEWSEAVHDTVVVPSPNAEPEPGSQETVGEASSASVADALNVTTAPLLEVASAVIGPGTVRDGGVESRTVTSNVPGNDVLPEASVAVQETWVVPSGKTLPDPWLQLMSGEESIASLAVTGKPTVAPAVEVASTEKDAGTEMVGGV